MRGIFYSGISVPMLITRSNLVHYLVERGLVTSESVVDGDVMVTDSSRRNRNFKVMRNDHPGYFVKQIQNWDAQTIGTLQREAACYALAEKDADLTLAVLMPKYYLYDAARHILVLGLLPEGESLSEYHRRLGKFPIQAATLLGRALGTYHRRAGTMLVNEPQNALFPKQLPWILSVYQQTHLQFNAVSAANAQLVGIVQKYPEFQQVLNTLAAQWQINSLIHGDMKWDNCVVFSDKSQDGALALKVVDWELSDFGDACWDVGAILQAYLCYWVLSMPIQGEMSPDQFVEQAPFALDDMQPALKVFWQTYLDTREVAAGEAGELLTRSVQYGAARMIQTVYEYMQYSTQLSPNALALLQVSLNILIKPQQAIRDLLDL